MWRSLAQDMVLKVGRQVAEEKGNKKLLLLAKIRSMEEKPVPGILGAG